jgi:hypothetical protein
MTKGTKTCGAETFSHIAELVRVARFFDGVHCGATILGSIDKTIQGVE